MALFYDVEDVTDNLGSDGLSSNQTDTSRCTRPSEKRIRLRSDYITYVPFS